MARSPLILVVDDHDDLRELLDEFLQYEGYRTATASDGHVAVERALELGPDLILLDLRMPRLDGVSAARRLRQRPRTTRTPIIAITAFTGRVVDRAFAAGVDSALTKPFEMAELVDAIDGTLSRRRRTSVRLR